MLGSDFQALLFLASAFVIAEPDWDEGRVEDGDSRTGWFEDRWTSPAWLDEVTLRLPFVHAGLAGWDHSLRIAVLNDAGDWTVVAEIPISTDSVPPPPALALADDPEALAFLERAGMTLEQFEFFASTPMRSGLPFAWRGQGIDEHEIPASIMQRIEGEDDSAATEPEPVGPGTWHHGISGMTHRAFLPEPTPAHGIRVEVEGVAAPMSEAWQIGLRSAPMPGPVGWSRQEWMYTRAWW